MVIAAYEGLFKNESIAEKESSRASKKTPAFRVEAVLLHSV